MNVVSPNHPAADGRASRAAEPGHRCTDGTEPMRLASWNCKGALRRKLALVMHNGVDVLVVPEAEQLSVANNVVGAPPVRSILWVGDSPTKGLAILSFGDYEIEVHQDYDTRHRYILPAEVRGPESFLLFAVWTVPGPERHYYVEPLLGALQTYGHLLSGTRVVWAGDFNQNVNWDTGLGPYRFANFIDQLAMHDIHSVYHRTRDCSHGCEPDHTFYHHHNPEKGYHMDFVFASESLLLNDPVLEIGDHASWLTKSDHMPIFCTFRHCAGAL